MRTIPKGWGASQALRLVAAAWAATLFLTAAMTFVVLLLMHGRDVVADIAEVQKVVNWSTCAVAVGVPVVLLVVAAGLDWLWND